MIKMRIVNKDKFIFSNYFDLVFYIILSLIVPLASFLPLNIQYFTDDWKGLTTTLFFIGAFFYDFYTKSNDDGKNYYVWVFLSLGRDVFGAVSLMIIILMIFYNKDCQGSIFDIMIFIYNHVVWVLCYPALIAIEELIRMRIEEILRRKRNIKI